MEFPPAEWPVQHGQCEAEHRPQLLQEHLLGNDARRGIRADSEMGFEVMHGRTGEGWRRLGLQAPGVKQLLCDPDGEVFGVLAAEVRPVPRHGEGEVQPTGTWRELHRRADRTL